MTATSSPAEPPESTLAADPIGDVAMQVGGVCDCSDPRKCVECRKAARMIWMCSPGHREGWWNAAHKRVADAVIDVCWRATQYGQTDDGDVSAYLVTKGAMHRLIGAARGAGISASFRADSGQTLPDESPAHVAELEAALTAAEARLREVEALHGDRHWCIEPEREQLLFYRPTRDLWPCATLAALTPPQPAPQEPPC